MSKIPVALQMYTLREQTQTDFSGSMRAVAKMGYAGVELAGYGGLNASELRRLLDELHLRVAGDHVSLARLEDDLPGVIAFSKQIGNQFVVCPAVPPARREGAEGWKSLAKLFNDVGQRCTDAGLNFCYHNHAFEFDPIDGTNGFAILYGATNPNLVKMELDMFWAKKGNDDPAAIMRRYAGRVPLVHLKDMTADAEQTFAEVGEGTLDFQSIFNVATVAGVQWYIVEQDRCKKSPLESVETSIRHLREWGIA